MASGAGSARGQVPFVTVAGAIAIAAAAIGGGASSAAGRPADEAEPDEAALPSWTDRPNHESLALRSWEHALLHEVRGVRPHGSRASAP